MILLHCQYLSLFLEDPQGLDTAPFQQTTDSPNLQRDVVSYVGNVFLQAHVRETKLNLAINGAEFSVEFFDDSNQGFIVKTILIHLPVSCHGDMSGPPSWFGFLSRCDVAYFFTYGQSFFRQDSFEREKDLTINKSVVVVNMGDLAVRVLC